VRRKPFFGQTDHPTQRISCQKLFHLTIRYDILFYLFFLPRFLWGMTASEGAWSRRLASALWEAPMISGEEP